MVTAIATRRSIRPIVLAFTWSKIALLLDGADGRQACQFTLRSSTSTTTHRWRRDDTACAGAAIDSFAQPFSPKFTESGLTQGQRLSLPVLIEYLGRRRGGE